MVIVRAMGGLGNQLQQYALYRKLESIGREARLDTSWFHSASLQADVSAGRALELDYFEGLPCKAASGEEIRAVLGRLWEEPEGIAEKLRRKLRPAACAVFAESGMYHDEVFSMDGKYLVGYWACEKYYADLLKTLRADLIFPRSTDSGLQRRNDEAIRRMEETASVSVHIRRGDYLDDANRALFGGICTEAYYRSAIGYVKAHVPNAKFYLFSDDAGYLAARCQGGEYEIVDWNHGRDSFYDMMLMSHCRHNICANSTFSFWGARLNAHEDKTMIRPSVHKNTQECIPKQMKALWEGWTLITPQGGIL